MTASIEELFASLEPKSTATFASMAAPDEGSGSPARCDDVLALDHRAIESSSHVGSVQRDAYHTFVGSPTDPILSAHTVAELERGACGPRTSLTHFNFGRSSEYIDRELIARITGAIISSCDFRSVALPDFNSAWEDVRVAQSNWHTLIDLIDAASQEDDEDAEGDDLLDWVYEESSYTPRPRNIKVLKDVVVRVDPNATRAARIYSPDDAEGWVR